MDVMNLPLDFVIQRKDRLSQVRASSSGVYWLASIAAEDGRTTIRRFSQGVTQDLTPEASVRTRTMEYGGGAYDVDQDTVVFNDDRTNQVFLLDSHGLRAITPEQRRYFFGGLTLSLADGVIVAVREDHEAVPEPCTELVTLPLDEVSVGTVIATGADFYASPSVMGGEVAWQQWDHPNMSWDTSSVWRASLDGAYTRPVFSQDGVSAQYPMWMGDGRLAYVSDEAGFWNWAVVGGAKPEHWECGNECATPLWVLDRPVACVVGLDQIASIEIVDGYGQIALWTPSTGAMVRPLPGTAWVESIASHGKSIFTIVDWPDRPSELIEIKADGDASVLAGGGESPCIASAQSRFAGEVQFWFYAPPGVKNPPLIVKTHGGPTSQATCSYDEEVQFWLSRGFAMADVNYRGSTGFGRKYRDALKGNWGVTDVEDVTAVVEELVANGLVDHERIAIKGGSAGGYTTLQSLVNTDLFAAGLSRYGIGDLETLVRDTHKAESRYTFSLVGNWPEEEAKYKERSPIYHLDRLSTPMLIMQGSDDKVVPPSQAYEMADAVRAAGKPLSLVVFEGEGHGFRTQAACRAALESELSFLQQVFEMPHSDDIPRIEIEGL